MSVCVTWLNLVPLELTWSIKLTIRSLSAGCEMCRISRLSSSRGFNTCCRCICKKTGSDKAGGLIFIIICIVMMMMIAVRRLQQVEDGNPNLIDIDTYLGRSQLSSRALIVVGGGRDDWQWQRRRQVSRPDRATIFLDN